MVICMTQVHARQPRQPAGQPTGGQFAGASRPESTVQLVEDPSGGLVEDRQAAVHGEVSSYAADLAQNAIASQEQALARAEAASAEKTTEAQQAAALRERAARHRLIRRWWCNRKAGEFERRAQAAETRQLEAEQLAANAADEAGRMNAGVRAEQEVVDALQQTEGVRHVICGINFGPGLGDVDVTAVGTDVVVVEVKAGGGQLVALNGGAVSHGGKVTPRNPLSQCAKQVASLQEVAGVSAVGVVCYPDATPSLSFDTASGCYLVGGTDHLKKLVTETMQASNTPVNARAMVVKVQHHLAARYQEIQEWIRGADERINRWEDTIARSWGWSQGPEIRANLGRLLAENYEKANAWRDMAAAVNTAYWSNARMLEKE